jgi:7-cyano-7-deazaguanine tRNA-ribosyltransferase
MQYFDCCCEVCSKHTPKELLDMPKDQKIALVALHNLYSIKAEVDRTKQAIHEGRLWEYVTKKIRAHPKLFETIDVLTGNSEFLGRTTPKFKENAVFLFTHHDQLRPEVLSYHNTVRRFKSDKRELVIVSDSQEKPFYLSKSYRMLQKKYDPSKVQFCQFNPVLGIIPLEISDLYPASHYLMSDMAYNPQRCTEFAKTWKAFFANNKFRKVHLENSEFLDFFKKQLPKSTSVRKTKMKKKE